MDVDADVKINVDVSIVRFYSNRNVMRNSREGFSVGFEIVRHFIAYLGRDR